MGAFTIFRDKQWGAWEFHSDILGAFIDGFCRSAEATASAEGTSLTITALPANSVILSLGGVVNGVTYEFGPAEVSHSGTTVTVASAVPIGTYTFRYVEP